MDVGALTAKAETLQQLIDAPELLVLPNIWDVAGTRIVENEGFPVIATSSAGIAWSLGYPDGENISREDMLFVAARIAASTQLPVTADLEAGYGEDPEAVAATVEAALDAGIVGANIEDSSPGLSGHPLLDFTLAVERIHAGREAADSIGVPFVINARTDGFFGDDNAIDETVSPRKCLYGSRGGVRFCAFRQECGDHWRTGPCHRRPRQHPCKCAIAGPEAAAGFGRRPGQYRRVVYAGGLHPDALCLP